MSVAAPHTKALAKQPELEVAFAAGKEHVISAQRLRYRVFVEELGAQVPAQDQNSKLEQDEFDRSAEHLLLFDRARPSGDQVVGTYRLIEGNGQRGTEFSSHLEYDLTPLVRSQRRLMELSRSCLHPDYRDGIGMYLLWKALSDHVRNKDIDVLFGVASFPQSDGSDLALPLSFLHHRHLAPEDLRPTSRRPMSFDLVPKDELDRTGALRQIPALIKAYLRLGGTIGDGAFVDTAFNTTDVCMVLDLRHVNERQSAIYGTRRP